MKHLDIKTKDRSHLGVIKSLLQNAHRHISSGALIKEFGGNLLEM